MEEPRAPSGRQGGGSGQDGHQHRPSVSDNAAHLSIPGARAASSEQAPTSRRPSLVRRLSIEIPSGEATPTAVSPSPKPRASLPPQSPTPISPTFSRRASLPPQGHGARNEALKFPRRASDPAINFRTEVGEGDRRSPSQVFKKATAKFLARKKSSNAAPESQATSTAISATPKRRASLPPQSPTPISPTFPRRASLPPQGHGAGSEVSKLPRRASDPAINLRSEEGEGDRRSQSQVFKKATAKFLVRRRSSNAALESQAVKKATAKFLSKRNKLPRRPSQQNLPAQDMPVMPFTPRRIMDVRAIYHNARKHYEELGDQELDELGFSNSVLKFKRSIHAMSSATGKVVRARQVVESFMQFHAEQKAMREEAEALKNLEEIRASLDGGATFADVKAKFVLLLDKLFPNDKLKTQKVLLMLGQATEHLSALFGKLDMLKSRTLSSQGLLDELAGAVHNLSLSARAHVAAAAAWRTQTIRKVSDRPTVTQPVLQSQALKDVEDRQMRAVARIHSQISHILAAMRAAKEIRKKAESPDAGACSVGQQGRQDDSDVPQDRKEGTMGGDGYAEVGSALHDVIATSLLDVYLQGTAPEAHHEFMAQLEGEAFGAAQQHDEEHDERSSAWQQHRRLITSSSSVSPHTMGGEDHAMMRSLWVRSNSLVDPADAPQRSGISATTQASPGDECEESLSNDLRCKFAMMRALSLWTCIKAGHQDDLTSIDQPEGFEDVSQAASDGEDGGDREEQNYDTESFSSSMPDDHVDTSSCGQDDHQAERMEMEEVSGPEHARKIESPIGSVSLAAKKPAADEASRLRRLGIKVSRRPRVSDIPALVAAKPKGGIEAVMADRRKRDLALQLVHAVPEIYTTLGIGPDGLDLTEGGSSGSSDGRSFRSRRLEPMHRMLPPLAAGSADKFALPDTDRMQALNPTVVESLSNFRAGQFSVNQTESFKSLISPAPDPAAAAALVCNTPLPRTSEQAVAAAGLPPFSSFGMNKVSSTASFVSSASVAGARAGAASRPSTGTRRGGGAFDDRPTSATLPQPAVGSCFSLRNQRWRLNLVTVEDEPRFGVAASRQADPPKAQKEGLGAFAEPIEEQQEHHTEGRLSKEAVEEPSAGLVAACPQLLKAVSPKRPPRRCQPPQSVASSVRPRRRPLVGVDLHRRQRHRNEDWASILST